MKWEEIQPPRAKKVNSDKLSQSTGLFMIIYEVAVVSDLRLSVALVTNLLTFLFTHIVINSLTDCLKQQT